MRIVSCFFCKKSCFSQCTKYFISGYMMKTLAFHIVFPKVFCCIQHVYCTDHIGVHKIKRRNNGTIYMAFCSKMYDTIRLIAYKDQLQLVSIRDICFLKKIVGLFINIPQIFEIACIGQCIKINYSVIRVFFYK